MERTRRMRSVGTCASVGAAAVLLGGLSAVAASGAANDSTKVSTSSTSNTSADPIAAKKQQALDDLAAQARANSDGPKPTDAEARAEAQAMASSQDDNLEPGVVETQQGFEPPTEFQVSNLYTGPISQNDSAGTWFTLLAGQTGDAFSDADAAVGKNQSAVQLCREDATGGDFTLIGTYPVQGADGPVHVVSASGSQVTLSDETGATFTFDAGAFVSS